MPQEYNNQSKLLIVRDHCMYIFVIIKIWIVVHYKLCNLITCYCFFQNPFLNVKILSFWAHPIREQHKCLSVNKNITNCNIKRKPFTMKLDTPEFKSLFTEALCQLAALFSENGYEIRIAGGAVRWVVSSWLILAICKNIFK